MTAPVSENWIQSILVTTHLINRAICWYLRCFPLLSLWEKPIPCTSGETVGAASSRYHYGDVIMGTAASQITSLTIVYSTIYSGTDQRKHQSSASLAFVRGTPVNSPHQWPVTRKMFPFADVIMAELGMSRDPRSNRRRPIYILDVIDQIPNKSMSRVWHIIAVGRGGMLQK